MNGILRCLILLLLAVPGALSAASAAPLPGKPSSRADRLLDSLSTHPYLRRILQDAAVLYRQAGLNPAHISVTAFKIGYLEKAWVDSGYYVLPDTLAYRKKHLLTVVDYTKKGNVPRLVVVDLRQRKKLYQSLVSHGSARGANSLQEVPRRFCNTMDSWCSSPGLILTTGVEAPENPCHRCRYSLARPHACMVLLAGLEPGINDSMAVRDIVMHTTGTADFSDSLSRSQLGITDTHYRVLPQVCTCNSSRDTTASDNKQPVKTTSAYASACGIQENKGYIGRSNGCLTLPEEGHIPILETVCDGSLIFSYTDAQDAAYLSTSPLIRSLLRWCQDRSAPVP